MAEIVKIKVNVETVATISLNDSELCALDALAGYSHDKFIQFFYDNLGKAYLQPYEAGLRSFLKAVQNCKHMTTAANECREFLDKLAEDPHPK